MRNSSITMASKKIVTTLVANTYGLHYICHEEANGKLKHEQLCENLKHEQLWENLKFKQLWENLKIEQLWENK